MNENITVSKIVGSPSESSWAQASSTGKLYITLSLTSDSKSGIIALGKETLEQIQREFFALDDKSLSNIKNAVAKVFNAIDPSINYSSVVATISNGVLYIITAGTGVVIINRNNNLAEVARGVDQQIIGFSGRLSDNDLIIIETQGFNEKISNKLLAEYAGNSDSEKLSESLAPFIMEDSTGREAAVAIGYNGTSISQSSYIPTEYEDTKTIENENEEYIPQEELSQEPRKSLFTGKLPKIAFANLTKKQKSIAIFALLIVALLIGSLFAERFMDHQRKIGEEFNKIYNESSEKYESASAISSLNRGRALEEVNSAIASIEGELETFGDGSDEHKKLSELLDKLKSLRDTLGGGSEVAGNVIFSKDDSEVLKSLSSISESNGNFVVSGDGGYAVINLEGDLESENEVELDAQDTISDDNNLYVLSDKITRVTISNGNTRDIIENADGGVDISIFGSTIYLLTGGGEVKKYSGSSFSESDYFENKPNLSGSATSFAIDSSIYILSDKGTITKFTRGENDAEFSLDSNMKISRNSILYSREGFENIYVLDIDNSSIVQIDANGKIQKQFNSMELQNAKSFAVSSDESKVVVVIENEVYSYDL